MLLKVVKIYNESFKVLKLYMRKVSYKTFSKIYLNCF